MKYCTQNNFNLLEYATIIMPDNNRAKLHCRTFVGGQHGPRVKIFSDNNKHVGTFKINRNPAIRDSGIYEYDEDVWLKERKLKKIFFNKYHDRIEIFLNMDLNTIFKNNEYPDGYKTRDLVVDIFNRVADPEIFDAAASEFNKRYN